MLSLANLDETKRYRIIGNSDGAKLLDMLSKAKSSGWRAVGNVMHRLGGVWERSSEILLERDREAE